MDINVETNWPAWKGWDLANSIVITGSVIFPELANEVKELESIAKFLMPRLDFEVFKFTKNNTVRSNFYKDADLYKMLYNIIAPCNFHKYGVLNDSSIKSILNQYILRFWRKQREFNTMKYAEIKNFKVEAAKKTREILGLVRYNYYPIPLIPFSDCYFMDSQLVLSLFKEMPPKKFRVVIPEVTELENMGFIPNYVALYRNYDKVKITFIYSFDFTASKYISIFRKKFNHPKDAYIGYHSYKSGESVFLLGGDLITEKNIFESKVKGVTE